MLIQDGEMVCTWLGSLEWAVVAQQIFIFLQPHTRFGVKSIGALGLHLLEKHVKSGQYR